MTRRAAARGVLLRRLAALAMVIALVVGGILKQSTIGHAVDRLRVVDTVHLLLLLGAWALSSASRGVYLAASAPGLSLGQGLLVTESGAGVGNALPGGVVIGQGLRIAMCRSWGLDLRTIGLSILASGTATFSVLWALPVASLGLESLWRGPSVARLVMLGIGLVIIGAVVAGWVLALGSRSVPERGGRIVAWVVARWLRGVPELTGRDWQQDLDEIRASGRTLWRRRGALMIAGSAGYQLGMFLVLLVSMRTVGVAGLTTYDAFRAFALVRVATVFVPTPGGLGTIDAGLPAAMVDSGADLPSALAAVVLFRIFTYALPLLTGAISYGIWRIWAHLRGDATAGEPAARLHRDLSDQESP